MKIECTQSNLQKGLGLVSRSVGTRTTMPVLANVLLKTEGGRLRLSATDLEIGVSAIQSVSVFMNKHFRSVRSYVKNGEVKSNESIQGRLHDIIVYSLIMLSLIEEE